jgi:adenine-specific DNA-methyltransferase
MTAGSVGQWEPWDGESTWSAPANSSYAVLFDEAEAASFGGYVESRSQEITHAWIVTDSHLAFLDAQKELPDRVTASQLYRDYLRNFVVNAPGATR